MIYAGEYIEFLQFDIHLYSLESFDVKSLVIFIFSQVPTDYNYFHYLKDTSEFLTIKERDHLIIVVGS